MVENTNLCVGVREEHVRPTTRWTWGCWRGMRYEGVWDSQPGAGTQPKTDLGNNSNNYITSGFFMRININTIEKHGLNSTSESPINIHPFGDLDMKALCGCGKWECVWCGVNGQLCGGGEEEARDGPAEDCQHGPGATIDYCTVCMIRFSNRSIFWIFWDYCKRKGTGLIKWYKHSGDFLGRSPVQLF